MKKKGITAVLIAALFIIICVILFLINRAASDGAKDPASSAKTGVESTVSDSKEDAQSSAAGTESSAAADSRTGESNAAENIVNPDGQGNSGSNSDSTVTEENSENGEEEVGGVTVTEEFTIELQENEAVGGF